MRTITEEIMADALIEWERRYREEPERFQSEAEKLLKNTPHMYGRASACYLMSIIEEQEAENDTRMYSPAPPRKK